MPPACQYGAGMVEAGEQNLVQTSGRLANTSTGGATNVPLLARSCQFPLLSRSSIFGPENTPASTKLLSKASITNAQSRMKVSFSASTICA
jgi:hypothetical protein